ncbi:hypothetical protein [uncultured Paraglaciecola sp.]|uniref:hypothetical protein n=1 Tax=uncultured Paraglaciecola sp. TaxID=1765024 RepID=UPI002638BE76|nr:hypothetical protein [uncultured Paraglaciecola sp.]
MNNLISRLVGLLLLSSSLHVMGNEACDKLKSGSLVSIFGSHASAATFRPGSEYIPHTLCTATWNKPDYEALNGAVLQFQTKKAMA